MFGTNETQFWEFIRRQSTFNKTFRIITSKIIFNRCRISFSGTLKLLKTSGSECKTQKTFKKKMRKKKIKIPIYFGTLEIVTSEDRIELSEKYKIEPDGFDAMVFKNSKPDFPTNYVALFVGKPTNKIIAHEVVHIVSNIFHDRGITKDLINDEPEAYLTGFIFEQIEKFFS